MGGTHLVGFWWCLSRSYPWRELWSSSAPISLLSLSRFRRRWMKHTEPKSVTKRRAVKRKTCVIQLFRRAYTFKEITQVRFSLVQWGFSVFITDAHLCPVSYQVLKGSLGVGGENNVSETAGKKNEFCNNCPPGGALTSATRSWPQKQA